MNAIDSTLCEVASRQHAVVLRDDARTAGLTRHALVHRLERGDWVAEGRRVLRRAGAPTSRGQRLMIAVLDAGPGAVVSHTTAAAWWGLPGYDVRPIHVTRPRGITSSPARFARLHEVLDLQADHVTVLDAVPVVRPERLVFELCASLHPGRAERALDAAWSRGLLSGDSLRRVHAELAERGRKGTVLLRELLEKRPPGYVPPASNLEARFARIVEEAGLPRMRRQVDCGDGRWVGRVDFLAEDRPLVVEVQSERYHASLCDRADDARRVADLEAAGFGVVEVWDVEVWSDPAAVVERIRRALTGTPPRTCI